ncbi:MAG TPA: hypothetical protein PLK12_07085 [Prolixibacteraceae bacterium]|nr:hypothetical protein [Prolixibacteraceae bacterium]
MYTSFILILLLFSNLKHPEIPVVVTVPYAPNQPEKVLVLPDVLREVSGIVSTNPEYLACIEDESGTIYHYSLKENVITARFDFGYPGDYEGITLAGNSLYIIRSDGVLFEVEDYASGKIAQNFYPLNIPYPNCEGVVYDRKNNRLLIASKGKSADKDEKRAKQERAVYSFNLRKKELDTKPFLEIYLPDIEAFMNKNGIALLRESKKNGTIKAQKPKLRSSGIAIHPVSGDLYILSASEHLLYVFHPDGKIANILQLDEILYPKAEGITFTENGDMFISNEGEIGPPTLVYIPAEK